MPDHTETKTKALTVGPLPSRIERKTTMSHFMSLPIKLIASAFLAVALASSAQAGASQNFGAQWAWNNNFNNSAINATFGTGSNPSMTFSYNFGSYSLYGYPACIRGWHYGWNPTGDTLFPMQVSAATSIPCTFSYTSSGSSMAGDFAYDMFLRWDNAKSTPQLEVMVWGGNDSWPIGTQTGTSVLSAGGWTFDLWEGMNSAAGYYVYTFIPHGTAGVGDLPTSGSVNVDMKVFFNWLQANRAGSYYNNSMYLDVVEAGLEITRGNGSAWITANINASTGGGGGGGCTPTAITPYVQVNGGTWTQTASASLAAGGTVMFGPQPTSGGSWKWSGPNGFSATTREVSLSNVQTTQAGTYTATYTNPGGCNSTQNFVVTVTGGGGGGGGTVANGTYKIINRNSAKALDVTGNGTADGTFVEQWTYNGGNNQRWTVTSLGSGQYSIIGVGSSKALEVASTSTANGTRVDIRSYSGANNQKWTLTATSGGYFRVTPVSSSGSCLDVNGNSTADGAIVQEWTYGGGNNEQWIFQAP